MDLSNAFNCIPHDLLAAKLHAYGLSEDTVTFAHSYLKRRKQAVKINALRVFFKYLYQVYYIKPHFRDDTHLMSMVSLEDGLTL